MALSNFRDLSTAQSPHGRGFQFEFCCQSCERPWRSAFQPYREDLLRSLTGRVSTWVGARRRTAPAASDWLEDPRARDARRAALGDAVAQASTLYSVCPECGHAVCADCWHPGRQRCLGCAGRSVVPAPESRSSAGAHARVCPNCHAPGSGGRFCTACGFDMAITHKTCPGCGTMLARQARFCTDCGHGF
jgi:ribosomal protein L32